MLEIILLEISFEYEFNGILFVTYNSYTIENLWSNFYLNYQINPYEGCMSWIMKPSVKGEKGRNIMYLIVLVITQAVIP
jgi:hypothetical protein